MSSGYIQTKDNPGPTGILQALRQAMADDPRLKATPAKEVVRRFIAGRYLSGEPSAALVADVLEILRAGGLGLRSPTVRPCLLEFLWDDDAGRLITNLDLGLFMEWEGAPAPWEARTVPEKLTHSKTPSCTDLISDPKEVLSNKERWPLHLCDEEFLRQSTERWAQTQRFTADNLNIYRWASMHPLPVGRRALMASREVGDLSEWSEVLNVLPFEGYETAAWALRVEVERSPTSRSVVDLFGLAGYPTEYHKEVLGIPVGGDLAFVLRGRDASLIDLVHNAERWWSRFRGRALRGRPRGSGTWANQDEFTNALSKAVETLHAHGRKVTQENVADVLNCNDRVLRTWIKRYSLDWGDF